MEQGFILFYLAKRVVSVMVLENRPSCNHVDGRARPKNGIGLIEQFKLVKPRREDPGAAYIRQIEEVLSQLQIDCVIMTTVVTDAEVAAALSIADKKAKEPLTEAQALEVLARANVKIDAADLDMENGEWFYWEGNEAKEFEPEVRTKLGNDNKHSTAREDCLFRIRELGKCLDKSSLFWQLKEKLRTRMGAQEMLETYYDYLYFSRNEAVLQHLEWFFPTDIARQSEVSRSFADICFRYKIKYERFRDHDLRDLGVCASTIYRPDRTCLQNCHEMFNKYSDILFSISLRGETNENPTMRKAMLAFLEWFGHFCRELYPLTIRVWQDDLQCGQKVRGNPSHCAFSEEIRQWYTNELGDEGANPRKVIKMAEANKGR